jgi:hypothetical protein
MQDVIVRILLLFSTSSTTASTYDTLTLDSRLHFTCNFVPVAIARFSLIQLRLWYQRTQDYINAVNWTLFSPPAIHRWVKYNFMFSFPQIVMTPMQTHNTYIVCIVGFRYFYEFLATARNRWEIIYFDPLASERFFIFHCPNIWITGKRKISQR